MYKLNFDLCEGLINWNVIYWGIKQQIITVENALCYANKLVEAKNEDNSLLIELFILDDVNRDSVLSLIESYVSQDPEKKEESMRILRYIILYDILKSNQRAEKILSNIENVYVAFNYPSDMNSFISYMPIDDSYNPKNHSQDDNEERLLKNFEMFLKKEKAEMLEGKVNDTL